LNLVLIERDLAPTLAAAARTWPAVTLTGPRQSGKTTLCTQTFRDHPHVSLEAPDVRAFAVDDPRGFLAQLENGAFIDEVQRVPELLSYLQGAIDADPTPDRWMLTGSHNLALLQSVSQSLAGRTAGVALVEARATATPNSRLLDGPRRVWTDLTDDLGDVSLSPSTAVLIRSTAATGRWSPGTNCTSARWACLRSPRVGSRHASRGRRSPWHSHPASHRGCRRHGLPHRRRLG